MSKSRKSRGPRRIDADPTPAQRRSAGPGDALGERLVFSFRHLDLNRPKFPLPAGEEYLGTLLRRLRDLSDWTAGEFIADRSRSLRAHRIDFVETSEPGGFDLPSRLVGAEWQFSLSSNEHGRVHGHLVRNVFHVVWLDPDHRLYA